MEDDMAYGVILLIKSCMKIRIVRKFIISNPRSPLPPQLLPGQMTIHSQHYTFPACARTFGCPELSTFSSLRSLARSSLYRHFKYLRPLSTNHPPPLPSPFFFFFFAYPLWVGGCCLAHLFADWRVGYSDGGSNPFHVNVHTQSSM